MDGEVFGPYALDVLRSIHLTPDILVLSTSLESGLLSDTWMPASEYPELADSLYGINDEAVDNEVTMLVSDVPEFNAQSVFYIRRGGMPYGPYNLDALATVGVECDTVVSLDGMANWFTAGQIDGLLTCLDSIKAQNTPGSEACNDTDDLYDKTMGIKEVKSRVIGIVKSIFAVAEREKTPYRVVFDTADDELKYVVDEYNKKVDEIIGHIKQIIAVHSENPITFSRDLIAQTVDSINSTLKSFTGYYEKEFARFETASGTRQTSTIAAGSSRINFASPFSEIVLRRRSFVNVLGSNPLLITYNESGCGQAEQFIDSMVGYLYKGNTPRTFRTIVFDVEDFSGLNNAFKALNRDLYSLITDATEMRDTVRDIQSHISNVIRNLLIEPGMTLRSYNNAHDTKEPYILLVVKNIPSNMQGDTLNSLRLISKNGPRAGVHLAVMMNQDIYESWTLRANDDFDLKEFEQRAIHVKFVSNREEMLDDLFSNDYSSDGCRVNPPQFEYLTTQEIVSIVEEVNSQCELKEDVIISLSDYVPNRKNWWKGESSRHIEIPFGLSSDRSVASLKITQESGQNSAIVIGIPGSGKSVFLHSLILNSAFKYSPDELRMYLIDFSGVEFNAYALGHLPHARVIAPEAEREFGISILRELEEEGSRRMELCRRFNVNNIVELKRVAPNIKIPRLLVIIDEFQKLFDESNDRMSQEANAKIHIIIQEFRKFGINLILATQKLPASSLLPRDLIANRVVFKCTPNDFQSLITMENSREVPRLRTGECIYNSESGASYDNTRVQGFFARKEDIDRMLGEIAQFGEAMPYEHEQIMVFRSDEQPEFARRRRYQSHITKMSIPSVVPVYLGESIAVNDIDVNIELVKENTNNVLVIGGESAVAQRIVYNSILSAISVHEPDTATVLAMNGMRADNKLWAEVDNTLSGMAINYSAPHTAADITEMLVAVQNEIENRRKDENAVQPHIYIVGFDIQSIRAFDPDTSSMITKPSAASKVMSYILNNGPAVGVFTILNVDTPTGLSRIDPKALDAFNYRVALQMPENASMKIMDSYAANKLFVFNRPASRFRAYMRDNLRNLSVKFKPYR